MAFNTVSALFGRRGSGKTDYLKGNAEFNIPGFIRMYLEKDMKVLILDTIDHPSYRDISILQPEQLGGWKKGVYRCFVRPKQMSELTAYINSLESMWNTFIVYEDAYKHTKEKVCDPICELIIDSKQKNIDVLFMYHAFGWAPKDLYRMIDLIELFKTKDHPKCRKDDMPGYYEDALELYEQVKAHKSPFFHKLIDTGL